MKELLKIDSKQLAACLAGAFAIIICICARIYFFEFFTDFINATPLFGSAASTYISRFSSIEKASRFFSSEFLSFSAFLVACIFAQTICLFILESKKNPTYLSLVVTVLVSIVAAFIASPFFAAFPPIAGFLCRINCPESLCYPKPYSNDAKYSQKIGLIDISSCAVAVLLALMVIFEFCSNISTRAVKGPYLWLVLGIPIIIGLYVYRGRKRQGEIPGHKFFMSTLFHASCAIFWFVLILIAMFS